MARSYVLRLGPGGAGLQKVEIQVGTALVPGDADAGNYYAESYSLRGASTQLQKITTDGGVLAVADYPDDGTGLTASATSTSITLPASASDVDRTGMFVALRSGTTGVPGQVRRVTNYASRVCTVAAWDVTPSASDIVETFVDTEGRSSVVVKAEFESSVGDCIVIPIFLDYPRDPSKGTAPTSGAPNLNGALGVDGAKRRTRRYYGQPLGMSVIKDPTTLGTYVEEAGFFHGWTNAQDCRGATGIKLRLHVAPSGPTKIALWVGST